MNNNLTSHIFLTWLDVERLFKKQTAHGTVYSAPITGIHCYSNSVEIEFNGAPEAAKEWIVNIFGTAYDEASNSISLRLGEIQYPVIFIKSDPLTDASISYPLWSDVAYVDRIEGIKNLPQPWTSGPRVTAFHSFKGGVGRTTALMSYVAATLESAEQDSVRLLVVDADLEAPGISFWLDSRNRPTVSFTQFLEALHYPPVSVGHTLDFFAQELKKTSLDVGSARREVFVLPSALALEAMMDMPVKPEHLARNPNNPWQLSEHLRALGERLGATHIFVDLRAGLSELSSPLLFDPRVEHFFVTTVAAQSVIGMSAILERLYALQASMDEAADAKPTVILSMLTPELRQLPAYREAIEALNQAYPAPETEVMSTGFELLECDFSPTLMSLGSFRDALNAAPVASSLYPEARTWARNFIATGNPTTIKNPQAPQPAQNSAESLHRLCTRVEFAEQVDGDEMLATEPLRNLGKHFAQELPNAVSIGAKGAGKTFTFLQVCRAKVWSAFLDKLEVQHAATISANIFPALWSSNLFPTATESVRTARQLFLSTSGTTSRAGTQADIDSLISSALRNGPRDWAAFWDELICAQVGVNCSSLSQLNAWLVDNKRELVLIFDGIEDHFSDLEDMNSSDAVRALLQLPNRLSEITNRKIGAIVFVRADYVRQVIRQNVAQYLARFKPFALEWTPESFLRLSYWLCGHASIVEADPAKSEELTVSEILLSLEKLWGKKLGKADSKEARSAIWVFGVLCDLNGRFQARDLVRFLRFAAEIEKTKNTNTVWSDRVLAPESMRQAIPKSSEEKVQEAVKEIAVLRIWVEELNRRPISERKVPFDPAKLGMNSEAINNLRELGVIYEDIDQPHSPDRYYLPEIYRQGLKFETSVGGRPRTLALLKRNLPKLPF